MGRVNGIDRFSWGILGGRKRCAPTLIDEFHCGICILDWHFRRSRYLVRAGFGDQ
jgi:hypothetical protein